MQDLTLVGVHDDGEHLVLENTRGERFSLPVDEALRVAVRRDRARLGQIQIQMDGGLRPREIQARIRAGQTAEAVAEAAGVPVEHVRRYEGPVLAEREFVVRQARAVRVRRAASAIGAASAPTLEDLVQQRLAAREVDEGTSAWDAWRTEDGTWVVALTFTAANRERRARWTYDVQLRHVTALDDEARWLTDEELPEEQAARRPQPPRGRRTEAGADAADHGARAGDGRTAPAGERVYDVEADGGVRPAGDRPERDQDPAAATVDLLDTLRERRGRRQRITLPEDDGTASWPADSATDALDAALESLRARAENLGEPPAAHPPRSRPELARDAELLVLPEDGPEVETPRAGVPAPAGATPGARPPGRRGARSARPEPPAPPAPSAPPEPASRTAGTERSARTSPGASGDTAGSSRRGARPGPAPEQPAARGRGEGEEPDQAASRRARRASVPSWDDIVFGQRRE